MEAMNVSHYYTKEELNKFKEYYGAAPEVLEGFKYIKVSER